MMHFVFLALVLGQVTSTSSRRKTNATTELDLPGAELINCKTSNVTVADAEEFLLVLSIPSVLCIYMNPGIYPFNETVILTHDIIITTNVARGVVLTSQGNGTVLKIARGANVYLNGLNITQGLAHGDGGGIRNDGNLTATNCSVYNNKADYPDHSYPRVYAAGIYNTGSMMMIDCLIFENHASVYFPDGGGVCNGGNMTMTRCSIFNNSVGYGGGALFNAGTAATMIMEDCLIFNNSGSAGAVYMDTINSHTGLNKLTLRGGRVFDNKAAYNSPERQITSVSQASLIIQGAAIDGKINCN